MVRKRNPLGFRTPSFRTEVAISATSPLCQGWYQSSPTRPRHRQHRRTLAARTQSAAWPSQSPQPLPSLQPPTLAPCCRASPLCPRQHPRGFPPRPVAGTRNPHTSFDPVSSPKLIAPACSYFHLANRTLTVHAKRSLAVSCHNVLRCDTRLRHSRAVLGK